MTIAKCPCSSLDSYPSSTKFTSVFIYRASEVTKHDTGRPNVINRVSETQERLEEHIGQGGYTVVGALIQMSHGLSLYTTRSSGRYAALLLAPAEGWWPSGPENVVL